MRSGIPRCLTVVTLFTLLSASLAQASGQAFFVRSFSASAFEGMEGDREAGPEGAFWVAEGGYGEDSAVRLSPSGALTRWRIDDGSGVEVFPLAVKWDPARAIAWALGYQSGGAAGFLYRLTPSSGEVVRTLIPFRVARLTLDAAGEPWVFGSGKAAVLSQSKLLILELPRFLSAAAGPDASGRVWLESDDGSILALRLADRTLLRYETAGAAFSRAAILPNGDVWAVPSSRERLIRFRPETREKSLFPFTLSRYSGDPWAGMRAAGPFVALASYLGPHVLLNDVARLRSLGSEILPEPSSTPILPETADPVQTFATVAPAEETLAFQERVFYVPDEDGRQLFVSSASPYNSLIWGGAAGEFLTGQRPIQWWRPLASGEDFATRAFLPAVVEVRPADPVNNFFSELTVTNLDAAREVKLTLTLSGGKTYTMLIDVPVGGSTVFPNVIRTFRDAGASFPEGDVAGTLSADFRNGTGRAQARVYSSLPGGATTGLGLTSLDPAAEAFVFRRSLNGLKNTGRYRTNVAVANLCGFAGECPVLDISVDFFDDATGRPAGSATLSIPPHELRQLNSPLAGFGDLNGESFSVLFQPFSTGQAAYDAYATVIDSQIQDFVFIRASAVGTSNTVSLSAVSDADGAGTRWTSECAITNTAGFDTTADLTFTSAVTGKEVKHVLNLGRDRGVFYPNVVDFFRRLDPPSVERDDFGPVRIQFRDFGFGFASSRTVASNGMGLGMTGLDPYYARAQWKKRILGLKEDSRFRTNLAIVNLGPTRTDPKAPVQLSVTIFDRSGKQVGEPLVKSLLPGQLHQWNQILSRNFSAAGDGYTAVIERLDGLEPFDAYITVIDNTSQDPTFVRAE